MFNKLKRYLARKLLPYAEVKPQVYERTSLDIETLAFSTFVSALDYENIPESIFKKEIARGLTDHLIPFIKFESNRDDIYLKGGIQIRGTIRVVKER